MESVSSELYGYIRGTGTTGRGKQSDAVIRAMRRWGRVSDDGTQTATELHVPVCKRGYVPFDAKGNRMYGCAKHSRLRLGKMKASSASSSDVDGYCRPGWEPFNQWDAPP